MDPDVGFAERADKERRFFKYKEQATFPDG